MRRRRRLALVVARARPSRGSRSCPGRRLGGARGPVGGGSPLARGRRGVRGRALRDRVSRARALRPGRARPTRAAATRPSCAARRRSRWSGTPRRSTEFDTAETVPPDRRHPGRGGLLAGRRRSFRLRRMEEARDRYARFLALKPASPYVPEALYARGLAELEVGRADSAVDTFRDFLREYPNHAARADGRLQRGAGADPGQALGRRARPSRPVREAAIRGAPTSPRRAISSGWPRWRAGRPEGVRTLEQFIAQVAAGTSWRRRPASWWPKPRPRPAGTARRWSSTRPSSAPRRPTPLAPQALYRIGELALTAEPVRRTRRRPGPRSGVTSPSTPWPGRPGSPRPGSTSSASSGSQALQVAQSVADLQAARSDSDALLVVGQSALQLRRNPEAAQAYHAVVVEAPPEVQAVLRGPRGARRGSLEAGDRQGGRQARLPGDRRHEPGSGAGAAGPSGGSPGSRRRRRLRRPGKRPRPGPSPKPPRSQ